MWTPWGPTRIAFLLLLAGACSHSPTASEGKPAQAAKPGPAPIEPAPAPAPVAVPAAGPCEPAALAGTWLLASGTTSLTCADGKPSVMVAGGTVEMAAVDGALTMADGPCQHRFSRTGCGFSAPVGVTCTFEGVPYTVEALQLQRAEDKSLSLLYRMRRPDRSKPGQSCVDVTEAKLVHGAGVGESCSMTGRWSSAVTALGKAGPITLTVQDGLCSVTAPEYQGTARCTLDGRTLLLSAGSPWSKAKGCTGEQSARYRVSFAEACRGLVLESEEEPCEGRLAAIDYLFLAR